MRIVLPATLLLAGVAATVCFVADASASDRFTSSRSFTPASQPAVASSSSTTSSVNVGRSQNADGAFERKCIIMSCGTPWCYNARVR